MMFFKTGFLHAKIQIKKSAFILKISEDKKINTLKGGTKMKTERVNQIVASMKSFSKDKYKKDELLPEMLLLQAEIVDLTFKGEREATDDLRIWDVVMCTPVG